MDAAFGEFLRCLLSRKYTFNYWSCSISFTAGVGRFFQLIQSGSVLFCLEYALEDLFTWVTSATKNVKGSIIPIWASAKSESRTQNNSRKNNYTTQKLWTLNTGIDTDGVSSMTVLFDLTLAQETLAEENEAAGSDTHHTDREVAEQSCEGPVFPIVPGINGKALEKKQWTGDFRKLQFRFMKLRNLRFLHVEAIISTHKLLI